MDAHQAIQISAGELRARITPFGGHLTYLRLPDGRDVALAYGTPGARERGKGHIGSLIGRSANRIRGGYFELDGWPNQLPCNAGACHLHGGNRGFHAREWTLSDQGSAHLTLTLRSPAGDENYPGNLDVRAHFSLPDAGTLRLELEAVTDAPTLCNLTWHPYFNLSGHKGGHIGSHSITIDADHYLPMATDLCPTGEIAPVEGTPFDLRTPRRIGPRMVADDPQVRLAEGFDHCFVIHGEGMRRAARAESEDGRVGMELWTTQPGVQFYTGNSLSLSEGGKQDQHYHPHDGFCLEAQGFPDAPNHASFPSTVLRPGDTFHQVIEYRFEL